MLNEREKVLLKVLKESKERVWHNDGTYRLWKTTMFKP